MKKRFELSNCQKYFKLAVWFSKTHLAKQLALAVCLLAAAASTNVCSTSSARAPKAMAFEQLLQSLKDSTADKPRALAGAPIRTARLDEELKRKFVEEKRNWQLRKNRSTKCKLKKCEVVK